VACGDDFVVGVLDLRCLDGGEHVCLSFEPRLPEPDRATACGADGGGRDGEVEVGEPVADAAGAAEGEDDELVGSISGDETCHIGFDGADE
jgi:hypothetical protein